MDTEESSQSEHSRDADLSQEAHLRSVATKRKRVPSATAAARTFLPSAPSPTPTILRRSKGKNKDANPDNEKENSLLVLTKRFIEVAQKYPTGLIELNDVAEQLGVSKRRMYDITNVLEGINLIEKQSKNVFLWKAGTPLTDDQRTKISSMRRDVDKHHHAEKKLDASIASLKGAIQQYVALPTCYVHHDDVRRVPHLAGEMILAVKAAKGAEVAVEQAGNKLTLRSDTEVDVYVLTTEDGDEDTTVDGDESPLIQRSATPRLPTISKADSEPDLGPLGQIADAASNQAPVPINSSTSRLSNLPASPGSSLLSGGSLFSDLKTPSSSNLLPPSPSSPLRGTSLIGLPMDSSFHYDQLFPGSSSPLRAMNSPLKSLIPLIGSPSSVTGAVSGTAPSLLSLANGASAVANDHSFMDESTQPGMLNDGAIIAARLRSRSTTTVTVANGEHSNDGSSPFKSTARRIQAHWGLISTPEVSSSGFEDFNMEGAASPKFTLSPTSSPEKKSFPIGHPFGSLTHHDISQDGFAFFTESSIGLPAQSRS